MNNYSAHVWTLIVTIFTFMLAFFVWFFGFNNMKNTLTSDNLQDAVRTSAYLAQDKSARTERGAFVINKDNFRKYLNRTKIKQFGNSTLGSKSSDYTVYYLPDNSHADPNGNARDVSTGNGRTMKNDSTPWIASHDTTNSKYKDGGGYEAVRGIRVVIHANNKSKLVKDSSNAKKFGTFTATDVIQTYGKNQNHDTPNDLTR